MYELRSLKLSYRLIIFLLSFWIVGVFLAFFWGLGWFFLLESLRRLITYIPPLNNWVRKITIGEGKFATFESNTANSKLVIASKFLGVIIMLGWIGLTIFIFAKLNFPLVDIIRGYQP
jgi:hypothetical protein